MLQDNFGRKFKYLRLAVTDRCNFKCSYCLPNGYSKSNQVAELSLLEINNLVKAFVELGIEKIRLTGGEPTLRSDILAIASNLKNIAGIRTVAITTNAHRLASRAQSYYDSGINHLNISLDSLDKKSFKEIAQVDNVDKILQGIEVALSIPFTAIKINSVLLKSYINFDLFLDFIKTKKIDVRFIELMPTFDNLDLYHKEYLSSNTLRDYLHQHGWNLVKKGLVDGPADNFSHPDYQGRMGIINPYGNDFCNNCNRLRVDCYGNLILCLLRQGLFPLREYLQSPNDCEKLKQKIITLLSDKPIANILNQGINSSSKTNFSKIGG